MKKLSPRLKIFLIILAIYILCGGILYLVPSLMDSPLGIIYVFPFLSVYIFHQMGIPGLLEHNGLCGWGWCAPTIFGYIFLLAVWGALFWGLACLLALKRNDKTDKPI